jgi:phosphatidylglycerophosphate synthase
MDHRKGHQQTPAYKHLAVSSMRVPHPVTRRPIPSRSASWAIDAARWLRQVGVRPNQVSVMGVVIAAVAAACLILAGRSQGETRVVLLVVAAAAMPLRLLCNMLDGMLAVEGGLKTPSGDLYNELPDRLADLLILVGAGYAIPGITWGPELGWAAAATALLVAYVRTLGAAAGASQHFVGPMAKPRRMHVLIAACLLSAIATAVGWREEGWVLMAALVLIIAGGAATIVRRLRRIVADLEAA